MHNLNKKGAAITMAGILIVLVVVGGVFWLINNPEILGGAAVTGAISDDEIGPAIIGCNVEDSF